ADADAAQRRVGRWRLVFDHAAVAVDAAKPVGRGLHEPDRAVGVDAHRARLAAFGRDRKLSDLAVDRQAADVVTGSLAEPQRAVAHHDRQRLAAWRNAVLELGEFSLRRDAAD